MKALKLFGLLLTSLVLTGCGNSSTPPAPSPEVIEVEGITTDNPVVEVELNDYSLLNYVIWPLNATDKSISVNKAYLDGIADVTIDDDSNVYVKGLVEGTGVLSIVTSNGKYVSYSITVVETEPPIPPEPELPAIDRIAHYFNAASEDMQVEYILEQSRWFGEKNFGYSTDTSYDNLRTAAYFVKTFLPSYLFRYDENYGSETGRTEFNLLMVNSNISAAALITSYIEDNNLIAQISIENMW